MQPAVGRIAALVPVSHEKDMGPVSEIPRRQRVDADISAQAPLPLRDDVATGYEDHMASCSVHRSKINNAAFGINPEPKMQRI